MDSHDSIQGLMAEFLDLHADFQHSDVENAIRETVMLLGSADDRSRIFRLALHSLSPKNQMPPGSSEM